MVFQNLYFCSQISDNIKFQPLILVFLFTDVSIAQNILGLFFFVQPLLVIELSLFLVQQFLVIGDHVKDLSHFLSYFEDILVSSSNNFGHILPFFKEFMSVIMFFLEFLCCFVQLYLSGLRGSDLFVKFALFPPDFNRQLLDLQVELPDFGVVFLPVLLEGDVVFFFLLAGDGPLLKFFLVPVEL